MSLTFIALIQQAKPLLDAGHFGEASNAYRAALQSAASTPEKIAALLGLGRACLGLADYAQARAHNRAAFAYCVSDTGVPDSVAATCHHALGQSLLGLGSLSLAQRQFQQALALRMYAFGKQHRATLSSMFMLGITHHRLGHIRRAAAIHTECLDRRKAVLAFDDADITASLQAVAQIHFAKQEFDASLCLHQEALRRMQAHRQTPIAHEAAAWNAVGQALQRLGRYEAAREHLQRAEELFSISLGAQHPDTASVWLNLADLYLSSQPVNSLELSQKAHAVMISCMGVSHPRTAAAAISVARVLHRCGQYEAARALLGSAINTLGKGLRKSHPEVLKARRLATACAVEFLAKK